MIIRNFRFISPIIDFLVPWYQQRQFHVQAHDGEQKSVATRGLHQRFVHLLEAVDFENPLDFGSAEGSAAESRHR